MAVKASDYYFQWTCQTAHAEQICSDLLNAQRRKRQLCSCLTSGFWMNQPSATFPKKKCNCPLKCICMQNLYQTTQTTWQELLCCSLCDRVCTDKERNTSLGVPHRGQVAHGHIQGLNRVEGNLKPAADQSLLQQAPWHFGQPTDGHLEDSVLTLTWDCYLKIHLEK